MKEPALRRILEPVVDAAGLELEAIEIVPAGRRSLVRVVVDGDGENGQGPTLDELAGVSRTVSSALDDAPETGSHPYTLEVSTRGVNRPLTRPEHWRRNVGRLVTVQLSGEGTITGRITDATPTGATLEVGAETTHVQFTDVVKALIEVELNHPAGWGDADRAEEE